MVTRVCPNPECPDIELFGVQGSYGGEIDLCATCGTSLVRRSNEVTPQHSPPPEYRRLVPLCTPRTSSELAVITSLLRAEEIFFIVHNEHFGDMHVGVSIPLVNQRTILVPEGDSERAFEAVTIPEDTEQAPLHQLSVLDRVRMVLEAVLFGWVIPGRRSSLPE